MSVGTWIVSAYAPAALVAAASTVTGKVRPVGALATAAAAVAGPAVAAYTAVLVSDTAVPAWHDGHREMPFVFAGSATCAAAGLGMLGASLTDAGPARRAAVVGATTELVATRVMKSRMGIARETYETGSAGRLMTAAECLVAGGALVAATAGRRSRLVSAAAGAALLAGSACTRLGVFRAGVASANDPRYTVEPQRARLESAAGTPRG
jgi:hypothetical protein